MDDIKTQAAEWCERARKLREAPIDSRSDSLPSRLELIGAGLILRRQLDSSVQNEEIEKTRRDLLCTLAELQQLADSQMIALVPGNERHELLERSMIPAAPLDQQLPDPLRRRRHDRHCWKTEEV